MSSGDSDDEGKIASRPSFRSNFNRFNRTNNYSNNFHDDDDSDSDIEAMRAGSTTTPTLQTQQSSTTTSSSSLSSPLQLQQQQQQKQLPLPLPASQQPNPPQRRGPPPLPFHVQQQQQQQQHVAPARMPTTPPASSTTDFNPIDFDNYDHQHTILSSSSSSSSSSVAVGMRSRAVEEEAPPPPSFDDDAPPPPPLPPDDDNTSSVSSSSSSLPSSSSTIGFYSPTTLSNATATLTFTSPSHASPSLVASYSSSSTFPSSSSSNSLLTSTYSYLSTSAPWSSASSSASTSATLGNPSFTNTIRGSISAITSGIDLATPNSFAASMTANYEVVKDQINAGLYAAKRVASVIKKLQSLQENYAREVQRIVEHEKTKLGRQSSDGMKISARVWQQTQEQVNVLARAYVNNGNKMLNEVVAPLQDWYTMAEKKRLELNVEERRVTAEMAKAREEVVKSLAVTQKAIALCVEASGGESSSGGGGGGSGGLGSGNFNNVSNLITTSNASTNSVMESPASSTSRSSKISKPSTTASSFFASIKKKIEKSAQALQQDAAKAATNYAAAITQANQRQQQYLEQDLPRIFGAMQLLEQQRLDIVKQRLMKFADIQHAFSNERVNWAQQLQQCVQSMDTDNDMKTFIEDWVFEHGLPNPSRPYLYSLPCSPADILAGRYQGNPKSVFRSTLERCMELQAKSAPTLDVPRIVPTLIKAIRELNGFSSEGIFRISVTKVELEALHKNIENDNYDVLSMTKNPHVPAALLKEWLRLLAEPLFPDSMYEEAISLAQQKDCPTDALVGFFHRLPKLSQRVLEHIAAMAKEISSGENRIKSRMTVENLAIVFAPSFLRNPSDDPLKLLENSKFETKFTSMLFKALAP